MPKRSCPFDEEDHFIKKQVGNESKARGIVNVASEKTLQMLYRGASRKIQPQIKSKEVPDRHYKCFKCFALLSVRSKCSYCDNFICTDCMNICVNCDEDFCKNCSFPSYSDSSAVCYSCY